ncbi:MAG TPA: valine--tRNA ligase [Bdellovibrionota bacterium]|nr:valine--tRNA ligase [Bdellovibrionota bacterium]
MKQELSKAYNPTGIEEGRYAEWEKAGYFHVEAGDPRHPFSIVIPPPNVTGSLHMGHALDNTLQDVLIRYKRMDGACSLWIPGTDHAGIATQNVVERELAKEKITRQQLGRSKFIERVWQWKEQSGGRIVRQLRRLGASCDWKRERFTMDPGLSRAVRTVFVRLFDEGLIYRSKYLISWCPRCQTALSDLEVEHHDVDGQLTYFKYPLVSGVQITVATTRPETMLGDTAIAVHPDDKRYKKLVGQKVQHPFLPRTFPVIADSVVDPKFGTGAVKVTPAHDPNDYALGERHKLEFISIFESDATTNAETGPYKGLDRVAARKRVVSDLKSRGLFEKAEPHRHAVGHCQRCRTVIEPRISEQWFVKIAPLAKPAIDAVKKGDIKFVPEMWTKTYLEWMENIRDWCISRQLWWGHQIPVWYCDSCNEKSASVEDLTQCPKCMKKNLRQDPDVLDTWFSSALWPFSTLGWPDATPDLKKFYPTTVLVTGFDIIFFWVARMIMMGLKFTEKAPFQTVHIHALIRDQFGQKMSKSKGNVVDPLEIMDRYGTDAFRFALCAFAAQGRDIILSEKRIEGYRNFINKLWNAARFAMGNWDGQKIAESAPKPATLPDQWIRHRLNEVIAEVRRGLDEYRFNESAEILYQFTWHEFCDWYLEMAKIHLSDSAPKNVRSSTQESLFYVLDRMLRLLHPLIPFVTEEIWQQLPISRPTPSIMLAQYPRDDEFRAPDSSQEFETLREAIVALRAYRSASKLPSSQKLEVKLLVGNTAPGKRAGGDVIEKHQRYFELLGGIKTFDVVKKRPNAPWVSLVSENFQFYVLPERSTDSASEMARMEKERAKAAADVDFLTRRLADQAYRSKAPPQLVAKDEEKLKYARIRLERIDQFLTSTES